MRECGNWTLSTGLATLFLAGCGGMQVDASAPLPITAVGNVARAHRSPESSPDLLYVSNQASLYVFTYPQGKLVKAITKIGTPRGLCSDSKGDVFVTNYQGGKILEYAHGGTKPIRILRDERYNPNSCATDPVSGNLAVANAGSLGENRNGSVAVYSATGELAYYKAPNIDSFTFCTYDSSGNLFVDGYGTGLGLAELPAGSRSFNAITLSDKFLTNAGSLQWDGKSLAFVSSFKQHGPLPVYHVHIHGSFGRVVGKTRLHNSHGHHNSFFDIQYWIQGKTIIGQNGHVNGGVGLWRYPSGGKPIEVLKHVYAPYGVAVSVAPSGQ